MENSKATLIVIFTLLFLIFIAVSLFYSFYKANKTSQKMQEWAKEKNWQFFAKYETQADLDPFYTLVSQSLKSFYRDKQIKLTNIVTGKYDNLNFGFAFYKGTAGARASNNRRLNTTFNIFTTAIQNNTGELILMHRTKLIRLLSIEKLSNLYASKLSVPQDAGLDYLLVSNLDKFKALHLSDENLTLLKQTISEASCIILEKGQLVYIVQYNRSLDIEKIEHYFKNLVILRTIFSK